MRQTTNYKLPSWDSEDRILRTDFNDLTDKTDKALAENAAAIAAEASARGSAVSAETQARTSAVASLTAELAGKGNCQVYCTTYTGNGADSRTISFPAKPRLVMIYGDFTVFSGIYNSPQGVSRAADSGGGYNTLHWSGNNLTIDKATTGFGVNTNSKSYYVVALLDVTA